MLSLEVIKTAYPAALHTYERFIMREYMQYKILEIIFESPYESKLAFLGGTCLRLVHGNKRFSEDLNFDNFELTLEDFKTITKIVKKELERLGYEVEMRNVYRGAYHCYIRFPELLYKEGLSKYKEEKILIQLDTESHHFKYRPEQAFLNKFDVFTQINTTPTDVLLAQKFFAILNRKRNKGRDFFDSIYLLGQGHLPNYEYLNMKIGLQSPEGLRERILEKCSKIDMEKMGADVKPFLFNQGDEKKVILFQAYMKQVKLH